MKSGVYENITSWTDLASIPTVGIINSVIVQWVEAASGAFKTTQLRMSTAATNTGAGVQRPTDYTTTYNQKVWFQC